MALTSKGLFNAKATGADVWLSDPPMKGQGQLCARITPAGKKLLYFRYTGPKGSQVRIGLGAFDETGNAGLTLKDARAKAGELSLLYQSGIIDIKSHLEAERLRMDAERAAEAAIVAADRKAAEFEALRLTVKQLFEKWESAYLIKNHKDQGTDVRRLFEKDVLESSLAAMPAHQVRKGDVMELIDGILDRGANRVAQRIFSSLRQMFRYAVARDLIDSDPTWAIPKKEVAPRTVERDRTLSDTEIKLLAKKIPEADLMPTTKAAIWIALSTGCRIGELLKARWEHVNLDKRQWLIPSENSKNGIPLTIDLSDFALVQFRTIEQHQRSTWLYPARNKKQGDTHVSTKTITKQIGDRQRTKAMKNRSSKTSTLSLPCGKWHMHDLRRTASTIMGDLGIKPEVIDRCQNHIEPNRIRRTYQRYSYHAEMKQAWQLLGERLEALASNQDIAEVIQLKKKA